MRTAIPVWLGRVSPVFDVAGRLIVVDASDGRETARQEATLAEAEPAVRIRQILDLGVQHLVCGAISAELEAGLQEAGIKVTSQVCGNVDEVLRACLEGKLAEERFLMPGCCGRQRRMRGRCRRGGPWRGGRGV
ncbi:MAG: NifB/NifX family molybdenum-iron cluster-binding protein [Phycisphaerae bacterium]